VEIQLYNGWTCPRPYRGPSGWTLLDEVAFEGTPNQHVNWTLKAQINTLSSKVQEGRQILSNQDHLGIERPVSLTEDIFTLAML